MEYVNNYNDFLKKYYDKQNPIKLKDLDFVSDMGLEYLLWEKLLNYINENKDNNVELYALLSDMYMLGKGLESNKEKALKLCDIGVELGSLYCIVKKANNLIDKALITFEYDDVIKLVEYAVSQSFLPAINLMGWMYNTGSGYAMSRLKAKELFKQASDLGYATAMYNYGRMVMEDDIDEAINYLTKASIYTSNASYLLGKIYYDGRYVDQDLMKAYNWFISSAYHNNPNTYKMLGQMYEYGEYVTKDLDKAKYYYKLSIDYGNDQARKLMARMMEVNDEINSYD